MTTPAAEATSSTATMTTNTATKPLPKLPVLKLNLDEPGISRQELLAAFPNILELYTDPEKPNVQFMRCLICKKTLNAKPISTINHLKSIKHNVNRKAAEEGIMPKLTQILSKYPKVFRKLNHDTIQCIVCKTNFQGPNIDVKSHLESEFHMRSKAIRAQREAIERMSREEFDRLYVQNCILESGITVNKAEKIRKTLEIFIGRPLPLRSNVRRIMANFAENKDAKRISLPDDPMKPLRALKMVDKALNKKRKKKKPVVEEAGGGPKKKIKKTEMENMKSEIKDESDESETEDDSTSDSNSTTESSSAVASLNSTFARDLEFQANNFGL